MIPGRPLAAVLVALLATAAPAGAAIPSGNLLADPGAESAQAATDSDHWFLPDGWYDPESDTHVTAVRYGTTNFPTASDSTGISGGANFFAGGLPPGVGKTDEGIAQDIDVSGAASEIDAGSVNITLGGCLGGYANQDDSADLTAGFYESGGSFPISELTVAGPLAADRGNTTKLLARQATVTAPSATRSIHVDLRMHRTSGPYNDGYADNLLLALTGPGQAAPTACPPPGPPPLPPPPPPPQQPSGPVPQPTTTTTATTTESGATTAATSQSVTEVADRCLTGPDSDGDGIANACEVLPDGSREPLAGREVNVRLKAGDVFIKLPGASTRQAPQSGFVPLKGVASVPVGSTVDARKGTLALKAAFNSEPVGDTRRRLQSADFGAGIFRIRQAKRARASTARLATTAVLTSAPGAQRVCSRTRAAAPRKGVVRSLSVSGQGLFRAVGATATATARNARWNTVDRCDGTLTQVGRGRVTVTDAQGRRRAVVNGGRAFLLRGDPFSVLKGRRPA